MPGERLFQFVCCHLRQNYVLDDDRVTVDARGHFHRLDFVLVEDIRDRGRDVVQFHYLTIDNRIRLQRLVTQADELKVSAFALELNGLNRA